MASTTKPRSDAWATAQRARHHRAVPPSRGPQDAQSTAGDTRPASAKTRAHRPIHGPLVPIRQGHARVDNDLAHVSAFGCALRSSKEESLRHQSSEKDEQQCPSEPHHKHEGLESRLRDVATFGWAIRCDEALNVEPHRERGRRKPRHRCDHEGPNSRNPHAPIVGGSPTSVEFAATVAVPIWADRSADTL